MTFKDYSIRYPVERYCGSKLGNRIPGSIVSYTKPLIMRVKTDDKEMESGVAINDRGFNLNYFQIPCSASKRNAVNFT